LNRLPEIKRFIHEAAGDYPDLQVQYFGGDPRIKFIVSEDGSPMEINAYSHYVESTQGKGLDQFVNIANMNFNQVKQLLQDRGVKTRAELEQAAAAAASASAASSAPAEKANDSAEGGTEAAPASVEKVASSVESSTPEKTEL